MRRLSGGVILAAVVLGLGGTAGSAASASSIPIHNADRVVVVAIPGLRWADVNATDTPSLFAAAEHSSRGLLSVKAADAHTDCAAGMLTLGAGNRATSTPLAELACRGPKDSDVDVSPTVWAEVVRANEDENFGTDPGALGDALAAAGIAVRARGAALLAAVAEDGVLPGAHTEQAPGLVVISDLSVYGVTGDARRDALREVDGRLPSFDPNDDTMTIVVGAANAASEERSLQFAMAEGPSFGPGRLVSDSTDRAPYVQLIDVAPTVLTALGVAIPDEMAGESWRERSDDASIEESIHDLSTLEEDARQRSAWGGWFVFVLVVTATGICAFGCAVLFVPLLRRSVVTRRIAEPMCYLVASVPVASWLAKPFVGWPDDAALLFLTLALIAIAVSAVATLAARWTPWAGAAVVSGVTATVLAVDLLTGTHLQSESLLGDSSIVAGRFRGSGNTATSVFVTAAFVAIALLVQRVRSEGREVVLLLAVPLLALAVFLVGAPFLGNDFGGVVALVPAAVLFLLLQLGGLRWWALPGALAAGVIAAATVLAVDATLGSGHIGRFADDLVGGDAGDTFDRKLEASLRSWHSSWYVVMVFTAVLVVGLLVNFRRQSGLGRAMKDRDALLVGLLSAALCAVLGGVLNDSGVVVPGAAAVLAVPLLLAACLRGVEIDRTVT